MMPGGLRYIIRKVFNSVGLEIHGRDILSSDKNYQRSTLQGVLEQARNVGLSPATVIDVGAAHGTFALQCYSVFSDAKYILVEPLEEYKSFMDEVVGSIPNTEYILAAAHAESGRITINVHPDLVGSSLYLEKEDSNVNGVPRTVQAVSLDSLMEEGRIKPPFLLKIDVQGAELDVLKGAEEVLRNTEYALLEVSFFKFFEDGPQFYDIVVFMNSKGFVAYDIVGLQYRPLDDALSQADVIFVKKEGLFRKHHFYATRAQREKQDERFELTRRDLMRKYR